MNNRKRIFFISLLIILSLSLLIGCKTETPAPAALDTVETPQEQQAQEQPEEKPKEEPQKEEPNNPAESVKPADTTPQSTEKPAETDNKTCLQIEGSAIVEPITLSLDELKDMKDYYIEDDFFSLNSYGTKEYFHFKGVKIKAVLDKVVVNKDYVTISFIASDGYKQELTLGEALREDYIDEQNPDKKYPVIIAWHENGKDYDAEKGPPFRLVIGQKEPGDVNKPQWVQNVAKIVID